MQDPTEQQPGASGRRWQARLRTARERRHGTSSEPSKMERAIAAGVAGEELLGRELTALGQEMDLGVIHDLVVPGSDANIDHLVVGPSGVTVVDAKAWSGPVWIGDKTMRRGRRSKYRELVGVQEQIERVRAALHIAAMGDIPVDGLMCMVNANRGVPASEVKRSAGVGIGTIPSVRRHVARPGELDVTDIQQIHDVLFRHFVVCGGSFRPGLEPTPAAPHQPVAADELLRNINQKNARQVLERKLRRVIALCASVVAFVAVLAVTLGGGSKRLTEPPMTRAELGAMRNDLRARAAERAGGRVRGPAIKSSATEFSLRFRRGKRCRVRIRIDRSDRSQVLRSSGCSSTR